MSSVAFSPDSKHFYAGGRTGRVLLFDTSSEDGPVEMPGHTGTVHGLAFSPTGELVVSGAADRSLRIHDATSGKPLGDPLLAQTAVLAVAWSADSRRILSSSAPGCGR